MATTITLEESPRGGVMARFSEGPRADALRKLFQIATGEPVVIPTAFGKLTPEAVEEIARLNDDCIIEIA